MRNVSTNPGSSNVRRRTPPRLAWGFASCCLLLACGDDSEELSTTPDWYINLVLSQPDEGDLEHCFDGVDNNGNSLADCADPQCRILDMCRQADICPSGELGEVEGSAVAQATTVGSAMARTGSCGGRGPELSYTWTAPASGRYIIDSFGSPSDTVLYVRGGDCGGTELACADDSNDPFGQQVVQSEVRLELTQGQTIVVFVDGYENVTGESGGDFRLNITPENPPNESRFCGDFRDNDNDGVLDCADTDCAADAACTPLSGATAIVAAWTYACALLDDESTVCWGRVPQSGTINPGYLTRPATLGVDGFAQIFATPVNLCGVSAAGELTCMGSAQNGLIPTDPPASFAPPTPIVAALPVKRVSGDSSNLCFLGQSADDSGIWCQGYNNGYISPSQAYTQYPSTRLDYDGATDFCVGPSFLCAIGEDAQVRCSGSSYYMRGNTQFDQYDRPRDIEAADAAQNIACGNSHACILDEAGEVWCWGANWNGQLGQGHTMETYRAVQVDLPAPAVAMALGEAHSCALLDDGTVRCWGTAYNGALGAGEISQAYSPVAVTGLTDVVGLASGQSHVCAQLRDGGVRCWGAEAIGDGLRTLKRTPATVLAPTPAAE